MLKKKKRQFKNRGNVCFKVFLIVFSMLELELYTV